MSQSAEGHTLVIQIQIDNLGEPLLYKIDQVTLAEGKLPGNGDPSAQIHFDCVHCLTRYFIFPKILKTVKLIEVKKEPELDLGEFMFESGSSNKVMSDGNDFLQGVEYAMAPVKKEEIQESEVVANENRFQIQHSLDPHSFDHCVRIGASMKDLNQNNAQIRKKNSSESENERFYTCDICKASIKYRDSLLKHMKIHRGIRFSCSECKVKSFSDKSSLARHKKLNHQSEFRTCQACKWSQTCTKAEYLSHIRRQHPDFHIKGRCPKVQNFNGVDFPCVYCEPQATFKDFEELKDHLRVTHGRHFVCTRCPKAFAYKSKLNRHNTLVTHENYELKPETSQFCLKMELNDFVDR